MTKVVVLSDRYRALTGFTRCKLEYNEEPTGEEVGGSKIRDIEGSVTIEPSGHVKV